MAMHKIPGDIRMGPDRKSNGAISHTLP